MEGDEFGLPNVMEVTSASNDSRDHWAREWLATLSREKKNRLETRGRQDCRRLGGRDGLEAGDGER